MTRNDRTSATLPRGGMPRRTGGEQFAARRRICYTSLHGTRWPPESARPLERTGSPRAAGRLLNKDHDVRTAVPRGPAQLTKEKTMQTIHLQATDWGSFPVPGWTLVVAFIVAGLACFAKAMKGRLGILAAAAPAEENLLDKAALPTRLQRMVTIA